jgi:hypothetical protein
MAVAPAQRLCLKRSNYVITAEMLAIYHIYQNARVIMDLVGSRKRELPEEAV